MISPAQYDVAGKLLREESALTYGNFIQVVLEFLIIAFSVFAALRAVMTLHKKLEELAGKKPEPEPEDEPKETAEDVLKDIRTLLQQNKE